MAYGAVSSEGGTSRHYSQYRLPLGSAVLFHPIEAPCAKRARVAMRASRPFFMSSALGRALGSRIMHLWVWQVDVGC